MLLLLLVGCATSGGYSQPIVVIQAQVADSAQPAATQLEAARQGYLASGGKVAPDVKSKADIALGAFQSLSGGLSSDWTARTSLSWVSRT